MNRNVAFAALAYFAVTFAWAFLVGIVRTVYLAPRLGALPAVLLELPVVLTVAWIASSRLMDIFRVPARPDIRLTVGTLAFACLAVTEPALAVFAFGQPFAAFFSQILTPAGLAGLAGQIGFGLIPLAQSTLWRPTRVTAAAPPPPAGQGNSRPPAPPRR